MRKLGKLLPQYDRRTLRLSQYLDTTKLRPVPEDDNNYTKLSRMTMARNDELGCCVVSGATHFIQVWSSMAGREVILSDNVVERTYFNLTGGIDSGLNVLEFLRWWKDNSISGHPLGVFVSVNPTNIEQLKIAIHLFGGVFLGLGLPRSAQDKVYWDVVQGGPNSVAYSWGGHLVISGRYDKIGNLYVYTWGESIKMSSDFTKCYCDEAYVLLSLDWFKSNHKTPDGFAWRDLKSDLAKLG
jgi:hypothetical protein